MKKFGLIVLVGTLVEIMIAVPLCMNIGGDPVGPIVGAVFLWGVFFLAAFAMCLPKHYGSGSGQRSSNNQALPQYLARMNYYNTQEMRNDLDQMARIAQKNQFNKP